jgi:hypothetical protein
MLGQGLPWAYHTDMLNPKTAVRRAISFDGLGDETIVQQRTTRLSTKVAQSPSSY